MFTRGLNQVVQAWRGKGSSTTTGAAALSATGLIGRRGNGDHARKPGVAGRFLSTRGHGCFLSGGCL